MKSRKAQKRSSSTSRQTMLRKLLGRVRLGALEKLEDRQLMTATPWTDGFYYPQIGKATAWLPTNISSTTYAARADATNSASSSSGSSGLLSAEGAGTFSTVSEVEPNNRVTNAQFLNLGTAPGKDAGVNVLGTMPVNTFPLSAQDEDYYSFDLRGGDVFDAQLVGNSVRRFDLSITDVNGLELIANNKAILQGTAYPQQSPLSNVSPLGNSVVTTNLAFTIPKTGRYYARVSDGDVGYTLSLRVYRSPLESEPVNTKQKIFVDFNGATVRGESFGSVGTRRLSALSTFLPGWGLTAADENAMIDNIMAALKAPFIGANSVVNNGGNGWFSSTGTAGQYDIEFLNSRDNPDSFGDPNVSRLIIAGTALELGILTIGIAESVDVGNFDTTESAVILLDNITTPLGFGTVNVGPRVPRAKFIAEAIGRVAAHEAGHFLGNWHTLNSNASPQIMDTGGSANNLMGVGLDGIYGTDDDVNVGFGTDTYDPLAGFIQFGLQNSAAELAFGLPTGTVGAFATGTVFLDSNLNRSLDSGEVGLVGWRVYADKNNDGGYQIGEPQALSSANGSYSLALPPGTYTIREEVVGGFSQVAPIAKSYSVTVANGTVVKGLNFGNERLDLTATGYKWNDLDGNGLVDPNEPRLSGVWIYLDLDGDQRIDLGEPSTKTGTDGRYSLKFPGAGTYAVREVIEPGYQQTYPGFSKNNQYSVTVTGNAAIDATALAGLNFGNRFYVDLGDAPASYGTLRANNGAAHGFQDGLLLGGEWDSENDGQPNVTATGDDIAGQLDNSNQVIDDEDGVLLARPLARTSANALSVTAINSTGAPAYVHAWVDLNRDGDFTDSGEKVVSNVSIATGTQLVSMPALSGAQVGDTYMRVRLSPERDLGPLGLSAGGEVEDYRVTVVETPEIAVNDVYSVSRNSTLNSLDVTANDFRLPGEVLTILSAGPSRVGATLQITGDSKILFTPPNGFVGQDVFTYQILNSQGQTASATVTVNVNLAFDNPQAVDDSFNVATNSVSFPLNVLANDIEGRAGALSIISVTQPNLGGQISIATGGQSLRYTPPRDLGSTEQFIYTVADASGKTSTAKVTLHTLPGDQTDDDVSIRFVATDLSRNTISSIPQGQDFYIDVFVDDLRNDRGQFVVSPGVSAAYMDMLYNMQLVSTVGSQPGSRFDFDVTFYNNYNNLQLGDASIPGLINEFGAFTSSATMNEPGPVKLASLRFTARSPGLATFTPDPADNPPITDTILFNSPGSAVPIEKIRYTGTTLEIVGDSTEFPQAVDDSFISNVPTNSVNYPLQVLPNDLPGSTGVINLVSVTQPVNGSVVINNNGTPNNPSDDRVLYTPNASFEGSDSFRYSIQDSRGVQSSATVTVRVGNNVNANDDISLRLQLFKADGSTLADGEPLTVGSQFQLRGYVQDLRSAFGANRGVFAAFEDIIYSAANVSPVANSGNPLGFQVAFGPNYELTNTNGQPYGYISGDINTRGLINEIGAVQNDKVSGGLGSSEQLLFTITFVADKVGTASFIGDPADITPLNDSLLYQPPSAVPFDRIRYGFDSVSIVAAGGAGGEGFTNPNNPFDVNNDGNVTPMDALLLISSINSNGSRTLTPGSGEGESASKLYVDVNRDGVLSPMDALMVISHLNAGAAGEGESTAAPLIESTAFEDSRIVGSDLACSSLSGSASISVPGATASQGSANSDDLLDWAALGSSDSESLDDVLAQLAPEIDSFWKRK